MYNTHYVPVSIYTCVCACVLSGLAVYRVCPFVARSTACVCLSNANGSPTRNENEKIIKQNVFVYLYNRVHCVHTYDNDVAAGTHINTILCYYYYYICAQERKRKIVIFIGVAGVYSSHCRPYLCGVD